MYFSPTRTTEKISTTLGKKIATQLKISFEEMNITKTPERENVPSFSKDDVFILGLPVYAGRIPEIVEEYVHGLKGDNAKAVVIAVYGNRDYDDALLEMRNILDENGFSVIGACGFIGEHSFTNKVGTNRPDDEDLKTAESFGDSIALKIKEIGDETLESIEVKGNYPYKERGKLPPVTPSTNEKCAETMTCVEACPTGAISKEDPRKTDVDKCILCCECIKICPENAKFHDNEAILGLIAMLEEKFQERRNPEIFLNQ